MVSGSGLHVIHVAGTLRIKRGGLTHHLYVLVCLFDFGHESPSSNPPPGLANNGDQHAYRHSHDNAQRLISNPEYDQVHGSGQNGMMVAELDWDRLARVTRLFT